MEEATHYYGQGLPIDISTHGWLIDQVFWIMHVFMVVLFVGWLTFFLYTLIKFRQRPGHKANYAPKYTKFSTYLEVGVALFEVLILVAFAIPAWQKLKASMPTGPNVFPVRVVAEQFAWNIHYPGEDGMFGRTDPTLISETNPVGLDHEDDAAKDDVLTINELHVPVNRPILVYLSSKDVIHSFFIPVARVKQDAVPGMVFPVYFQAKEAGEFEIACAQLCGLGHYKMKGQFVTQSEEDVAAWIQEQREYMEDDEEW